MSRVIKKMQMDSIKGHLEGVRDMVFVNLVGLDANSENKVRLDLRKKGIRIHGVKNTLCRRVLGEFGMKVEAPWTGPTAVIVGGASIAELSKEVEAFAKKYDKKVKVKGAVADGTEVTFAAALKMPTKAEAIGRVVMLALSPARRIAGGLLGPAGIVSGQIKAISEKKEEAAAEAPAADAPTPA
ncbi:MAG: 50S ribosomal protein L10 [Planctomycetota bacterium]